jgi:hypothetical protein
MELEDRLSLILAPIHDGLSIEPSAAKYICRLLEHVKGKLEDVDCADLTALSRVLPGELAPHAEHEIRTQVHLSPLRTTLEYVAAEILELSGNEALDRGEKKIGRFHINHAVNIDLELRRLLCTVIPPPCLCALPVRFGSDKPSFRTVRNALLDVLAKRMVTDVASKLTWAVIRRIVQGFIGKRVLFHEFLDKIDIPTTRRIAVEKCMEKVIGVIVAGLEGETSRITYDLFVDAIMHNPVFDLVPYLR